MRHREMREGDVFDWVDGQYVMGKLLISSRTLLKLRMKGVLPYSRIGGKIYYKRSDIERVLQDNYVMFEIKEFKS